MGKLFLNELEDRLLSLDLSLADVFLSRDDLRSLFNDESLAESPPSLDHDLSRNKDSLDNDLSLELCLSLDTDLSLELYLSLAGGREDLGKGFLTLSLKK